MATYAIEKSKFDGRAIVEKLREEISYYGKYDVVFDHKDNIVIGTKFWKSKVGFKESKAGDVMVAKFSALRASYTGLGLLVNIILLCCWLIPGFIFQSKVKANLKKVTPALQKVLTQHFNARIV